MNAHGTYESLLVLAIKCPTCGVTENGVLRLPRRAFGHAWYCADCPSSVPPEERRLMFAVERTVREVLR